MRNATAAARRTQRLFGLGIFGCLLCVASWPMPVEARTPREAQLRLQVGYFNSTTLVERARQAMDAEVRNILSEAGVEVTTLWEPTEVAPDLEYFVRVLILDLQPEALGESAEVMASVVDGPPPRCCVRLFYPAVLGNLRVTRGDSESVKAAMVGGALGRIVVHEIVHALSPEYRHSIRGIMGHGFDRRILTRPGMRLDQGTAAALRRGIESLAVGQ